MDRTFDPLFTKTGSAWHITIYCPLHSKIHFALYIQVFELGPEGGDNETDGEVLAETDEMPYECGAR